MRAPWAWRWKVKGACGRGIYVNMKTALETNFVGKQRLYNRRLLQLCSHYLVDPVACTPASGWEKGQVESQIGLVRERVSSSIGCFESPNETVKQHRVASAYSWSPRLLGGAGAASLDTAFGTAKSA